MRMPRRNSNVQNSRHHRAKKKRKPAEEKNTRLVMYTRMQKQQQ
jgi:hypothetical protein